MLERDLAARAGLGWIGKNTMLLRPGLGSWFFIGVLLTTAELERDAPLPDRCGSCRACLDACPTEAFVAPYVLDARRCISYLTIEHRGEIDAELGSRMGEWQFGCDLCQSACPWNRKAPVTGEAAFAPSAPYPGAGAVLEMTDDELRRRFAGTPLLRPKPAGLRRNAAIALANVRARGHQGGAAEATADGAEEMNERTDEGEGTGGPSIDALLDRITLTPYGMPVRLMEAVLERGAGVTAVLAEALERWRDDEEHDALWLVVLLGETGDPDAVAPLIRQLHRTDLEILAEAAVEGLAKIGAPAVPPLRELARTGEPVQRLYAYAGLGWIEDDTAYADARRGARPRPGARRRARDRAAHHARPEAVPRPVRRVPGV